MHVLSPSTLPSPILSFLNRPGSQRPQLALWYGTRWDEEGNPVADMLP